MEMHADDLAELALVRYLRERHPNSEALIYMRAVPYYLRAGLARFIMYGVRPGGTLVAILSNDLQQAVFRADTQTRAALHDIVIWLANAAPAEAWGSPKAVADWCQRGGLSGITGEGPPTLSDLASEIIGTTLTKGSGE